MTTTPPHRKARRRNPPAARPPGVVFGTDFSENAHRAAPAAAAIARRLAVPLTLLHSIELPKLGADSASKLLRWLSAGRQQQMRREAESLRRQGTEVQTRLTTGRPDEVMVDLCRSEAPRLLVVASLGRRGMARWFLGSVAERTAERAPGPTVVVRKTSPWVDWAKGRRPLKVFVCFNHTQTSETAMRWVKDLAGAGACEITVGWVSRPADEWMSPGGETPLSLTGHSLDVQQLLERDLRAKVSSLLGAVPFRIRVEACRGRPEDRLAAMAGEENADLIVVGSHQYRGFELLWHSSVSRGLLHQAAMSVAVVPHVSSQPRPASLAPPVRQVLVATDFSEPGNAALPHAYSLLRQGGTVHLLHVLPPTGELPPGGRGRARGPGGHHGDGASAARSAARLRALVPADAEAHGISTQIQVAQSRDVAATICQQAERLGVDVVCLGSHGRSGWSKALLGSVAHAVLARSRRPLLVVRPPEP